MLAPLALALGASLVLATDAADAGVGKSGSVAVIALGRCDDPASAISARAFRALLATRLGPALQSEVDTAAPLGGLQTRTLADLGHAVTEARAEFYKGRVSTAATHLEELSLEVTRLPPSDSRWALERDVWTLLAQARAKSSRSTAEAALRRIYRVEPGYRPDTSLYPPSFRKLADDVRKKQAKAATSRLDVAVSPAGRDVYVDGRKLGTAPVSLRLPPGSYRVEADFGHRSTFRTVEVPEPPQLAPPLELAAEVEGALRPDGGPCVDPAKDPGPVLARTASLLRVERLLALHGEGPPDRRVLVLDDVDRSGAQTRQARARLSPGAPETEALAPLADLVATGRASAAVDVTRGTSVRTGPAVEGHLLGQLLGSPAPTGFTLEAYGVEGHVVREAVHLAGGRYDISEIPARRTVLHVTTDDGRVALAVVDTGHGELRKDLTLEQPCSVTGSLVDETGKPVGGARVFAALRPSGAWRATKSGPRGHFVIKELVRGDYELLSGSARARISVGRVSLSGACQAELPVVVVPRAALIGDPETESATRGQ